jgi:hypothetical protein
MRGTSLLRLFGWFLVTGADAARAQPMTPERVMRIYQATWEGQAKARGLEQLMQADIRRSQSRGMTAAQLDQRYMRMGAISIAKLPDAAVIRWGQLLLLMMERNRPFACAVMARGGGGPAFMTEVLSVIDSGHIVEFVILNVSAMEVFLREADQPTSLPEPVSLIDSVPRRLPPTEASRWRRVANAAPSGNDDDLCWYFTTMLRVMLSAPKVDAARLLRHLAIARAG